jgi:S-adenosylmethionine:tRNA ribosyltransferase-isomerase
MRVDEFDFDLPEDCIALRPMEPRDGARLLEVCGQKRIDHRVFDLPRLIRPGDTLVVNRTKVIPARLHGKRAPRTNGTESDPQSARIEATLHKRLTPAAWAAFAKPGKRLRVDDIIHFSETLRAKVAAKHDGGEVLLAFNLNGTTLDEAIAGVGEMPLPPYIASKRDVDARDSVDYQTAFAVEEGSVAAPTAGLHFTPNLIDRLNGAGVKIEEVTLHVGAGTFLPVKVDTTEAHKMHAEWGEVSSQVAQTLNEHRAAGGRIIAVGTTSLRLLESAVGRDGMLAPFTGETDIFITPGYTFRAIDGLLTNFHLPRSTLFMLVCALAGTENMKAAYSYAIESGYRFYSYGDACLLWPEAQT